MKKHYTLTLLAIVLTVAVSAQTLSLGVSVGGGGWAFPNTSTSGGVSSGNELNSILNRYAQFNAEAQLRGPWHLASSLRYEQRYYDANSAFGYSNQVVNRLILPLEMRWHYRNLSVGLGAYAGYRFGEAYSDAINKRLSSSSFALIDCLCYYVPPVQEDRRINAGLSASFSYRPLLARNLRALIEYNPMFDLNTGGEYDGRNYRSLSGTLGLLYEIN